MRNAMPCGACSRCASGTSARPRPGYTSAGARFTARFIDTDYCATPRASGRARGSPNEFLRGTRDVAFKPRGEAKTTMAIKIHPLVDQGVKQGAAGFAGGTLTCRCTRAPVTGRVASNVAFNHVCGSTKCRKPEGALLALVDVCVPNKWDVTGHGKELQPVECHAAYQHYSW